jgi:eukaryotic-like serine/threonine-protein kinase
LPHPDADLYPGQVFNERWKIGKKLGDGNFSLVYEVEDLRSPTDCAIKVLSLSQQDSQGLFEFKREATLLALLSHCSNVIDLVETGSAKVSVKMTESELPIELDVNYMVLERADATLTELLVNRHAVGWGDRLKLFRDVAKGVHQMHDRYVVHRDLKCDNTLLTRERVEVRAKVSDLGRSRNTREPTPMPAAAYEMGRGDLRFAPPEFLWGLGTETAEEMRRADLFLLGSILFEFATGQGLTGLVLGDPRGILKSKMDFSREVRVQDFDNNRTRIQSDFESAYQLFADELPRPIRAGALELIRLLTDVTPDRREPRYVKTRNPWDLQWLLNRVDRLSLELRIARRGHERFPWKNVRS